ncbi:hypothetical protein [Embleya sp. NPDC020886]|uniref:hypothetical protein n=1 Tax=Embleya sp. NPDC020886 TaxID=3363980 RepID=UPI0037BBCC36
MGVAVSDAVKRFGELAAALGADPNGPAITTAKTEVEGAAEAVKASGDRKARRAAAAALVVPRGTRRPEPVGCACGCGERLGAYASAS